MAEKLSTLNQRNDRVVVRAATPDDIPFVYSSWLRCYRYESPITKFITGDLYFSGQHECLDKLLSRPQVTVSIACDSEDATLIFGYVAYEPQVIHFVYVKKPFRHMGIASQLLESQQIDLSKCQATHLTFSLMRLWNAGLIGLRYNPYLLKE